MRQDLIVCPDSSTSGRFSALGREEMAVRMQQLAFAWCRQAGRVAARCIEDARYPACGGPTAGD